MDTGDPTNLFSNLIVLYAMYLMSYFDNADKFKPAFFKVIKGMVIVVGFICFIGWLNILTIEEVNNQYYIMFSETMRLGDKNILNIHIFFMILAIKMAAISGIEWMFGIDKDKLDKQKKQEKTSTGSKKKGA